jgi:ATP-dependent protease ClpP protease subunit
MRKTTLFFLIFLVGIGGVRADTLPVATHVYVIDGELAYVGELDNQANLRLFKLYESLKDKPKVLSIQSIGGSVGTGMSLGNWVRARNLDVKVLEYCLSSCANYVFPAGARKIVSNFAVIGFHGGADSTYQRVSEATEKLQAAKPRSKEFREAAAGMLNDIRNQAQQELAYLRTIGVEADFVSRGQEDRYRSLFKDHPEVVGWTYSVADFDRMGVHGIDVINPPWLPKLQVREAKFLVLPSQESVAPLP